MGREAEREGGAWRGEAGGGGGEGETFFFFCFRPPRPADEKAERSKNRTSRRNRILSPSLSSFFLTAPVPPIQTYSAMILPPCIVSLVEIGCWKEREGGGERERERRLKKEE